MACFRRWVSSSASTSSAPASSPSSADSRAAVDGMVDKALAAGGTEPMDAKDYGFMYQRGFQDLDGHLWEIANMDGEPG